MNYNSDAPSLQAEKRTGANPTVIVLVVVCGGLLLLAAVHVVLWFYARRAGGPKAYKKVLLMPFLSI